LTTGLGIRAGVQDLGAVAEGTHIHGASFAILGQEDGKGGGKVAASCITKGHTHASNVIDIAIGRDWGIKDRSDIQVAIGKVVQVNGDGGIEEGRDDRLGERIVGTIEELEADDAILGEIRAVDGTRRRIGRRLHDVRSMVEHHQQQCCKQSKAGALVEHEHVVSEDDESVRL
jgi:hypothetical protein